MNRDVRGDYYVAHRGRKYGPLTLAELSSRRLSTDMLVWTEDRPDWVPITDVPELRQYIHHAAAVSLVAPPLRPSGAATPAATPPHGGGSLSLLPRLPATVSSPSSTSRYVVAVTTIVLAVSGVLLCPLHLIGYFFLPGSRAVGTGGDGVSITVWSTLYATFFLVSIAMLAAGIGLLNSRRWAALTSTTASIACLVAYCVAAVFQSLFVLVPAMSRANANDDRLSMLVAGGLNGVALAMLVGFTWHVVSLVIVNSPSFRARLR